jgi:hypothetical protein
MEYHSLRLLHPVGEIYALIRHYLVSQISIRPLSSTPSTLTAKAFVSNSSDNSSPNSRTVAAIVAPVLLSLVIVSLLVIGYFICRRRRSRFARIQLCNSDFEAMTNGMHVSNHSGASTSANSRRMIHAFWTRSDARGPLIELDSFSKELAYSDHGMDI